MKTLKHLLDNNRKWAAAVVAKKPGFFRQLSRQQSPEYLWIGCADSRVPANEIVGLAPGELFVHRNVSNLVKHTDMNCLSVLQYAVDVLRVRHVIVCGHYGCGGIKAAIENERHGLIDNWLQQVKEMQEAHAGILAGLPASKRCDALCEINVVEQVRNVRRTTIVQDAWARGQKLTIHGWIYAIADGLLRDLDVSVSAAGR